MIRDRALATIRRFAMMEPRDRVVVAVSGGPDSVALLHLLLELRPELGIELTVAHLDHGLRGEASRGDRAFVEELAARLGLPCAARAADVAELARAERRSPEDAGRAARRRFLREVARGTGSRRVALAHHRDDQAETVLLALVRGTGRGGLSGIRPVSDGLFVRPLLEIAREEILAYLEERRIAFRVDASNADRRVPRNFVRHEVLPLLRASLNPRAAEAISRTADLLREEDGYLDRRARRALERILLPGDASPGGPSVVLDAGRLTRLPTPLARRVVRLALRRAGLPGRDLARPRIEEVLALVARGGNRALSLGASLTARVEYGRLLLEKPDPAPVAPGPAGRGTPPEPAGRGSDPAAGPAGGPAAVPASEIAPELLEVPLDLPGVAIHDEAGVVIRASLAARESVEPEYLRAPSHRVYLDAATLAGPLAVRTPRRGDRLHPLGAPGSRKLSDLWTDLKIGREARRRAVVVTSAGRIVWAVGLRMADPVRITDATREVAILEAEERPRRGVGPSQAAAAGAEEPSILYTAAEIRSAIARLAAEAAGWAAGREILVVGVLQGSFIFLADLVRRLPGPVRIGFVDREGAPIRPFPPLAGARVLLVEDILDTGESLVRILERLRAGAPAELRTCVLFDKPSGRKVAVEADWAGLSVPDRWVVGYGLDANGLGRNLPHLTWVPLEDAGRKTP